MGDNDVTMSHKSEKLRFRDYWNEKVKINRDDSTKCDFVIICIWGRLHRRTCSTCSTFGDELRKMCTELNLRDWWLFGLLPDDGDDLSWVNCRNRVDVQLLVETKKTFHLKLKYFPPNVHMRLSTKRYLLHQLLCDKEANIPNSDILTGPETSKIIDQLEQDKMYGAYSTQLSTKEPLIVTRSGVEVDESIYAYENIFGMSMTKDKKAIRIKFMDRSGSKSLILESAETTRLFRLISEMYVFYTADEVPAYMKEAHAPDLGIQILDLFNPEQGTKYKTFQFDLLMTQCEFVHLAKHAHMAPPPHRPLLTSQENHVSDAFYKLLNSLTCQICLTNQSKVLTEPCNHIVMCEVY